MVLEFLIFVMIVTISSIMSGVSVLTNWNWYNNKVYDLMTGTKSPRLSNLYYRVLMSKLFTCERCHYHHWVLILTSLVMYMTGNYYYNPIIESLPISLIIWYTSDK